MRRKFSNLNSVISVTPDKIIIDASCFRFSFDYYLREIIQDVLANQYQQQTIIVNATDGQNLKLLGFIDFLLEQCWALSIDTKKVVIRTHATDIPTNFTCEAQPYTIVIHSEHYINLLESPGIETKFIGCSTGRFSPARLRLLYELDQTFKNDAYLIAQFAKENFENFYKTYGIAEHDNLIDWCKNYVFRQDKTFEDLNGKDSIYGWTNSLKSYHNISHLFHIEVVIETDPFSSWWATEKIARCLVIGKPFVLFSGQHSLKQLREWGFTTFESLIDESYDQQPTPALRTKHMIKSLNELYQSPDRSSIIEKMYGLAKQNKEHYNRFRNVQSKI